MKDDCSDCPAGGPGVDWSRRSFLKSAGAMIGVAAFGFAATDAVALPVAFGTGTAGAGSSEHRYPVPDTDGVMIDRKNQVIVVRYQQHLYAFNLACPHENTALKWLPKDGRFQCPKHESRYQPTGTFIADGEFDVAESNGENWRFFEQMRATGIDLTKIGIDKTRLAAILKEASCR